jgi:hypothetical protein
MLIVEPFGGLGNRMRVVASAMVLAADAGQELEIVWVRRTHLTAAFDELFCPVSVFRLSADPGRLRWAGRSRQDTPVRRLAAATRNRIAGVSCCIVDNDFQSVWRGEINLLSLARSEHRLYVKTCEELGPTQTALATFRPIAALQQRIDAVTARFTARTIGVHIRGTDHAHARAESPIETFIDALDRELHEHPETVFFVSTDEPSVEQQLEERYSNHVLTLKAKTLARDTLAGAEDAVIDLFCLSRTRKILGSHWSSFSDVAARIGGIPLEVVRR